MGAADMVGLELSIRAPVPDDCERLALLIGQLGYPSSAEEVRKRLVELGASPADASFVAVLGGVVVGLASVHLVPLFHQASPLARITSFVIDEALRRRGIGAALVGACEAWARASGAERLEVTSSDRRHGAHAFYASVGFAREAQRFTKRLGPTC